MKNYYFQPPVFFQRKQFLVMIRSLFILQCIFFSLHLAGQTDAALEKPVADNPEMGSIAPLIADDNPPVALCKNATVYLNSSGTVTISPTVIDNGSYDLEGTALLSVSPSTFTCGPFPNNHQVTLVVTDNIMQSSSCTGILSVIDNQVPVFTGCPTSPLVFNDAPGQCTATPTWPVPASIDNCLQIIVQTAGPLSGSLLNNNTYLVAYNSTDPSGNFAMCSFNVIVRDAQPPVFSSCPSNITQPADPNCTAVVNFTIPSATDNCPNVTLVQTAGPVSGSTFLLGTTAVAFRATDSAGNTTTCAFTVTVKDLIPPNITCPGNISTNNNPSTACGAVVTYGVTSIDNCTAPTLALIGGLSSGSIFPVGVTTNTYRSTDVSNNTSTCSFTVIVTDVTLPNITCPSNIVKNNDTGVCGATITYSTPIATDNCSLAAGYPSLVSGLTSGSISPVGTTTNIWQAKDASNNTRNCSFTVTVNDVEPPTITCPANKLKGNDYGFCSAIVPFLGSPVFKDNCFVSTVTNNSPGTFPVGSTDVTWIVTDNHTNTASCVQNVTIEDREYPVLVCPSNIHVKTDEGDCIATIGYSAKATDNCAGLELSYSIEPFSAFNIGLTNVQAVATDGAGNSVNCIFQISVGTRAEVCNGFDDDCDGWVDESEAWDRLAKTHASDATVLSEYGSSVDIDGDYAIVGASEKSPAGQSIGAAYILFRDKNGPNEWGQIVKLQVPGLSPGDSFGAGVSISGGVAAVGAPSHDNLIGNEGCVYVFTQNPLNPSDWNFTKKITTGDQDAGDSFGASVALDGDHLLAGAPSDDETAANAGAAYIFDRQQGGADNWGQVAKLLALTGDANDNMGVSVAIDGDYAVVGANGVDGFWQDAGAAYVFDRNQNLWSQVARLKSVVSGQSDNFGISVAISGPIVIVGADQNDLKGTDAGIAFVFYKNQNGILNGWGQRNVLVDYDGRAGDYYGSSVAIDGEYAVVGARGDDDHFGADSGTGFVYFQQDNGWVLVGNLEDGGGRDEDFLGSTAAISGRTAIMGAPKDNAPQNNEGTALIFGGLCSTGNRPENRASGAPLDEAVVKCYPVPFSELLHIELKGFSASVAQVQLFNMLGQPVANLYEGAMEGDMHIQWRTTQEEAGVYFLRVTTDGHIRTQTLLLER